MTYFRNYWFQDGRGLVRAGLLPSVHRLDELKQVLEYAPIRTEAMLLAARLWAEARQAGQPTADPKALDGDVILAAQARLFNEAIDGAVVVATTNVAHLSRFVPAADWQSIE